MSEVAHWRAVGAASTRACYDVQHRHLTAWEALETMLEVAIMPTVAHPILDATMSPDLDSNKENES